MSKSLQMRHKFTKLEPMPLGLQALAEMHARDEAAGIDPFGVERSPEPQSQPTLVQTSFVIEPPDWDAEHREAVERERAARFAEAAALLETVEPPPKPDPPAPKQRKPWPNFS